MCLPILPWCPGYYVGWHCGTWRPVCLQPLLAAPPEVGEHRVHRLLPLQAALGRVAPSLLGNIKVQCADENLPSWVHGTWVLAVCLASLVTCCDFACLNVAQQGDQKQLYLVRGLGTKMTSLEKGSLPFSYLVSWEGYGEVQKARGILVAPLTIDWVPLSYTPR